MAVQLILKNSAVKDQKPSSGAALAKGELAMNSHALSPALYLKDTDGAIQQVAGVAIGIDAPGSPAKGAWWLDTTDNTLRLHDGTNWQKVAGGGGSGGGGGTTTIVAGDAINATKVGDEYTLNWDPDTTRGLGIVSGKAAVQLKTGGGLKFDGGELAIDPLASAGVDLGYKADGDNAGTVTNTDGDDATIPIVEDATAGLMTGQQKQKLDDIEADAQVNVLDTVAEGDGISVVTSGTTATVGAKLGAGLQLDGSGNIQATNPPLIYKGIVDLTSATIPTASAGDFYSSSTTGNISAEWGSDLANASAGDSTAVGDLVTYNGTDWNLIPTGGSPGATNLSNTPSADDVVVESSTGSDTTIAAATSTTAGVMSAADKASLDGDFVKLDDGGTAQNIIGGGGLSVAGNVSTSGIFEGGAIELATTAYEADTGFSRRSTNLDCRFNDKPVYTTYENSDDLTFTSFSCRVAFNSKQDDVRTVSFYPDFTSTATYHNVVDLYATAGLLGACTNINALNVGYPFGRQSQFKKVTAALLQLDTQVGQEAYNLRSSGTAPNFMKGSHYIGGTTNRNTLDVWKESLTEEQKEEYEAGTLAVPTDVATPGDGKWMRQWWYDRRTVEDQALIDSGELEYPTNLLPERFKDEFVLGDLTRVDILSTGAVNIDGQLRLGAKQANVESPGAPLQIFAGGNGFSVSTAGDSGSLNRYIEEPFGPLIYFGKSRNKKLNEHTAVEEDDALGGNVFQGSDGTGFYQGAVLIARADEKFKTGSSPGRLIMSTTPPNSNAVLERVVVQSRGNADFLAGITVSGGLDQVVKAGFTGNGTNYLNLVCNEKVIVQIANEAGKTGVEINAGNLTSGPKTVNALNITGAVPNGCEEYNAYAAYADGVSTVEDLRMFTASMGGSVSATADVYGYYASDSLSEKGENNYGFYSNVGAGSSSKNNFNVYAVGTASNYFRGNILGGGTGSNAHVWSISNTGTASGITITRMAMEPEKAEHYTTTSVLKVAEDGTETTQEVEVYNGPREDLLDIIRDLRKRVSELEAAAGNKTKASRKK